MPLPTPKRGEEQNSFVSRCMGSETVKRDFGSGSKQSQAVCFSQWKNSKQRAPIEFSYTVPIAESRETMEGGQDFLINGVAISVTTTENNHKFIADELRTSAQSLKGVPLLVDHRNEVSAIKGRVVDAQFSDSDQNVPFKARVIDNEIKNMIKDGRINSVSVGASVKEIDEDEQSGALIPRGIQFKELSLVAVPADPKATFTTALCEAYNSKIKSNSQEKLEVKGGQTEITMDKEVKEEVETTPTEDAKEDTKEEPKEEPVESPVETPEVSEMKSLKAELAEYKAKERKHLEERYESLCKQKKVKAISCKGMSDKVVEALISQLNLFESDEDEANDDKSEEVEDSPIEDDEDVDEKAKYSIKSGHGGIRGGAFWIER